MNNKIVFIFALVIVTCAPLFAQQEIEKKSNATTTNEVSIYLNSTGLDSAKEAGLDILEEGLWLVRFDKKEKKWHNKNPECPAIGTSLKMKLVRAQRFEPKGIEQLPIPKILGWERPAPQINLKTETSIVKRPIVVVDTTIKKGLFVYPFVQAKFSFEIGEHNYFNGSFDVPLYAGLQNSPLKSHLIAVSLGYRGKSQQRFGNTGTNCRCEQADVWTLKLEAGYKKRFGRSFVKVEVAHEEVINKQRIPLDKEEIKYWAPYGSNVATLSLGHEFPVRQDGMNSIIEVEAGASIDGGDFKEERGQGLAFFASAKITLLGKQEIEKTEPDKFEKWISKTAKNGWEAIESAGKWVWKGLKKPFKKKPKPEPEELQPQQ